MRESIEIEKHSTIDQEGKPLDSAWRALFTVIYLTLRARELITTFLPAFLLVRFDHRQSKEWTGNAS